ncbi:MAG TPA: hypothetical protein VF092_01760 [Longimicrobium sp.]
MRSVRTLTLALATLASAHAAAQAPVVLAAGRAQPGRADSARVLRDARRAQAAFERVRFTHLPWTMDSGAGGAGTCDEIVGRFCIWKTDTEEDWKVPPEHAEVVRERDSLIADLDRAAAASPGDAWVAGQRVRYLVEAGRHADAARAARECRAERWWCLALEGYASHGARDYSAAEASFAAALAAMPADARREWDALTPVLADGEARALRRMAAPERDSILRRLWWLADPLWMEPGNDRLTEHFARLVFDRLQDRARTSDGIFWAYDLAEILARWGQPSGWERVRPRFGQGSLSSVITHYHPSFEFLPSVAMARDPLAIRAEQWKMDERGAHSLYAPPGIRRFWRLPHQVAAFRRGADAEIVAAFEMDRDSIPARPSIDAGVVLMRDPGAAPAVRTARVTSPRGVVRISATPEQTVLSLEAVERDSGRAGRARFGIDLRRPAENGLALSDLLLLDQVDARPRSLDEAAPLARGNDEFRAGDRVAMFWEVYGLDARTDSLTFSLALLRRAPGGLRRTAESLGLARGVGPVRMRWTEEASGAVVPRSVGVTLPRLPAGDYVIEVTARSRSGASAAAQREITVAPPKRPSNRTGR